MLPEVSTGSVSRWHRAPRRPLGERCAVCGGDISAPHQANCSHWFCGHCIVGVWLHRSVLRPCDCPVCRRPKTLLVPSEVASLLRDEPEIALVLNQIEIYNSRFAGAPRNMIQRSLGPFGLSGIKGLWREFFLNNLLQSFSNSCLVCSAGKFFSKTLIEENLISSWRKRGFGCRTSRIGFDRSGSSLGIIPVS